MKKTLLLLALILWTGMQVVMAQSKTVRGTILDERGDPLPAAAVKVRGTQSGTITGMDGSFEITIPEGAGNELEIDAIGYGEKIVVVEDENTPLSIRMKISSTSLGNVEVVSTGYTTTPKEKYVGAADGISAERIEKFPVSNVTKAIEGAAPGIQVTNGGGQPGAGAAVRIRGFSSISASSAPLYVVDGAPYMGDISSINPSDIESLVVLKDATATSLYGSRGANGVIVITTKKGSRTGDKPTVTVDGSVGMVRRGIPNYNVMTDEKEYYETAWDAYRNSLATAAGINDPSNTPADRQAILEQAGRIASGQEPGEFSLIDRLGYNSYDVADNQLFDPVTGKLNPNANLKYHDDWEKELQRQGIRQNYNLSVSGGSEKSDYFLSAGYLKENGYVKFSDFERFSARLNVNTQATDWLKMGLNVSGALTKSSFFSSDNSPGYNPFLVTRSLAPIYPVYYRDANNQKVIDPLTGDYKYDWGDLDSSPTSSIGDRGNSPGSNVLGSLAMDDQGARQTNVVVVPYLEVGFLKDFKLRTTLSANYFSQINNTYRNPVYGQFALNGGTVSRSAVDGLIYTWNQILTYNHNFDLHHLEVLVGHENYGLNSRQLFASRSGLAVLGNTDLTGAATATGSGSQTDNDRIESYLANVNYDYNSTYLFTANVRRDGSSRFSDKWGTFWSVGGAWMLNKESFLENVTWLDMLKVKASYGTQGNLNINTYYGWQALYDINYANGSNAGAVVSSIENPNLTWESQAQLNAGVEGRFFSDRLSVEANYFQKSNIDLLFYRPYPGSTGINGRYENTMTAKNTGVELNIGADVVRTRDFTWNSKLTLTHFKNMITKMPEGQDSLLSGNSNWKEGHSVFEFYLVESTGVDPETGDELFGYYNEEGQWADTNNYSYATANGGRDYRGSALPDLMGSLTNTFTYKGFDLTFMLTFGLGGKYYDGIYQSLMSSSGFGSNYSEDIMEDRWTHENHNGTLPRAETDNLNIGQSSTRWLIDASYLSIRNVNLGYTFPKKWSDKIKMASIQAYVSADNIWLFSKRKGMDPQATFDGTSTTATYNAARTIMFGLRLGL